VKYLLDHYGTYEVLNHAGLRSHNPKETYKIPSWVPDWRVRSDYSRRIIDWLPVGPSSKEIVKANTVCLEDWGVLVCMGYTFGIIHSTGDAVEEIKPLGDSIGRVIWDNKWHRRKLIEHGVLSSLGTKLGTVANLFARSHPLTYRRKLATTKGGVLCLVPGEAQVGDLICQFVGGSVPFILRPLLVDQPVPLDPSMWSKLIDKALQWILWDNEGAESVDSEIRAALEVNGCSEDMEIKHCTFIGECFVDGLMDGKVDQASRSKVAFALN